MVFVWPAEKRVTDCARHVSHTLPLPTRLTVRLLLHEFLLRFVCNSYFSCCVVYLLLLLLLFWCQYFVLAYFIDTTCWVSCPQLIVHLLPVNLKLWQLKIVKSVFTSLTLTWCTRTGRICMITISFVVYSTWNSNCLVSYNVRYSHGLTVGGFHDESCTWWLRDVLL